MQVSELNKRLLPQGHQIFGNSQGNVESNGNVTSKPNS
jgi:hypothetical protein